MNSENHKLNSENHKLSPGNHKLDQRHYKLKQAVSPVFAVFLTFLLWSFVSAISGNAQPSAEPGKTEDKTPHLVKIPTTGYTPAGTSAESKRGQALFNNFRCISCHSLHNVGGDLAPMLDGVGARRDNDFLIAHLSNSPQAIEHYKNLRGKNYVSPMPHSRYSPETAQALVAYLKTIPEPPEGFIVEPHVPRLPTEASSPAVRNFKPEQVTDSSLEGQKLFHKFGCVACHAVGDVGGWLGPRLDGVGYRHTRESIQTQISDAQAHAAVGSSSSTKSPSKMPKFKISSLESKQLTDYLLTLPDLSRSK